VSQHIKYVETFKASKLACERVPGSVTVKRNRADAARLDRVNKYKALAAEDSGATDAERALATKMAGLHAARSGTESNVMKVRITGPKVLVERIRCYVDREGVLHIEGPRQAGGEALAASLLRDLFGPVVGERVEVLVVVPGTITEFTQQTMGDRTYVYAPPRKPSSSR